MTKKHRFLPLLLLLILLLPACGKPDAPDDPAPTAGLLSEVTYTSRAYGEKESADRVISTVRFTLADDGSIRKEHLNESGFLYYAESYSKDGVLLRTSSFEETDDGPAETRYTLYTNENGNRVKEEEFFDGTLTLLTVREYDDHGNLSYEQLSRIIEGKPSVQYTHRFENHYDNAGNLLEQNYTCDEESFQNVHTTWTYDDQGRLLRYASVPADGSAPTSQEYDYDDMGNVTGERNYQGEDLRSQRSYRYEYDDQGRILTRREQSEMDDAPSMVTEYRYDEAGEIVCTTSDAYTGAILSDRSVLETAHLPDSPLPYRTVHTSLRYGADGKTPDPAASTIYTTTYRYTGEATAENAALSALLLGLLGNS